MVWELDTHYLYMWRMCEGCENHVLKQLPSSPVSNMNILYKSTKHIQERVHIAQSLIPEMHKTIHSPHSTKQCTVHSQSTVHGAQSLIGADPQIILLSLEDRI